MGLLGLSAASEYQHGGYHASDRRSAPEFFASAEAQAPPPPAPEPAPVPLDVAFYASRFRADLTQLKPPAQPPEAATSDEPDGDRELFAFFGNLSVLLLAVRAGDLPRAQSAADALEMDVLVERNAGRRPADAHLLDDLGRLLGAAHCHDEDAARAAARDLADEFRHVLALPKPPPDPYARALEPETGGAAYETLAHFFDADAHAI